MCRIQKSLKTLVYAANPPRNTQACKKCVNSARKSAKDADFRHKNAFFSFRDLREEVTGSDHFLIYVQFLC